MRKFALTIMAILSLWAFSFAQQDPDDPGIQDSIIVGQIAFNPENSHVMVPIYAVTDDSIAFYNIPLGWFPNDIGVHGGSHALYLYPLTTWDVVFDSLLLFEGYMRTVGWYDLFGYDSIQTNVALHTNGERWHIMTLYFVIPDEWNWQNIRIDTVTDERGGPILMCLPDGMTEITPAFQYGALMPILEADDEIIPTVYSLSQNYPNPFNPSTNIEYQLPEAAHVNIEIYDINGRRITTLVDGQQNPGNYSVIWDASAQVSGIYFYRLQTQNFSQIKRCVMIK